jgi:enterochelin esterase family protein
VAPVVSPEVGADRTITLRYRAPEARQVVVKGELDGRPHPMTKDAGGIWSVTFGPLPPDIYTYFARPELFRYVALMSPAATARVDEV